MYHCEKCNKSFEKRHSFIAHCVSHYPKKPYKERERKEGAIKKLKKSEKDYKCKYCGWQGLPSTIGGHTLWCKLRPGSVVHYENVIENRRGKEHKHTQETKDKISRIRLEYLKNNPDKVPYLLNHSSKKSYPEQVFENALISSEIIGWIYNYQNGIYSYDFAFPELKIDVEIDGATHLTEKVKKIDERRDKFSKSEGWTVVRFTAKEVKKDVVSCINRLKDYIKNAP